MSDSFFIRCANCYRQHRRMARVVCLCGVVVGAPLAYSWSNHGDVHNAQAPVAAYVVTGTSTATSATAAVAMHIPDPTTYQTREVPGSAFYSMQAAVPAEQTQAAPRLSYKGVKVYGDVSSAAWPKSPRAEST